MSTNSLCSSNVSKKRLIANACNASERLKNLKIFLLQAQVMQMEQGGETELLAYLLGQVQQIENALSGKGCARCSRTSDWVNGG